MPTYRVTVAYDGSEFSGSQEQPDRRTVVGVLRDTFDRVSGERPALTVAGRTDSGAHAHGQVVGVTLQRSWIPDQLRRALDATLPHDLAVVDAAITGDGFHARRDAVDRTYRYAIVAADGRNPVTRRHAWTVRGPLDVDAMRRAAAHVVGRHDFAAFGSPANAGSSSVRTVHACDVDAASIGVTGADTHVDAVIVTVRADAFLRGMMRALAGALVRVGQRRADAGWIKRLLDTPQRAQLTVAPACGLHQWSVRYAPRVLAGAAA